MCKSVCVKSALCKSLSVQRLLCVKSSLRIFFPLCKNNMSFDSDCRSGASPGAHPLWGQKRHEIVDIWHLTRVSYQAAIIHHHLHRHSSSSSSSPSSLSSSLSPSSSFFLCILPPAFFQATLSSGVFICFYPCASAVSFFEAKLVLQSLRSVLRTSLQTLQHSVVQCSWNLAWATVLGHVAWHLFIGTLLGNLFLGALLGNLFLGAYS